MALTQINELIDLVTKIDPVIQDVVLDVVEDKERGLVTVAFTIQPVKIRRNNKTYYGTD